MCSAPATSCVGGSGIAEESTHEELLHRADRYAGFWETSASPPAGR
ncbi:hypothetical protein [Kitasatospora sp. NPDC056181]